VGVGRISQDRALGFWFVCRKDRLQKPKIAAFRDWIFEQAGAQASPAAA
jgi:DNA-binding transcriptional LysR family regulator